MTKPSVNYSRRTFTKLIAMGLAGLPLLSFKNDLSDKVLASNNELDIHLFSKHLQFLDYNKMSIAAAEMGFDGLDLTVRKNGHVLPENVVEDLPKAVTAMKKYGLAPKMITTNVWDAQDIVNQNVF